MSITLLDLYNRTASQPWSMFDNDAVETGDFELPLLSAINKALVELWCSYPFEFRLKDKTIITQKYINKYKLPDGSILQKGYKDGERYAVTLSRRYLDFIEDPEFLDFETGRPIGFFIKNNSLCFYPAPDNNYKIDIAYFTFAVGLDSEDKPIYALREATDRVIIPEKYEELFINALIAKSMMYVLASPSDENYPSYAEQFDKAYKLLIKSAGGRKKSRRVVY